MWYPGCRTEGGVCSQLPIAPALDGLKAHASFSVRSGHPASLTLVVILKLRPGEVRCFAQATCRVDSMLFLLSHAFLIENVMLKGED